MACHAEVNLRTGNPDGADGFCSRSGTANRAGSRMKNRERQHGDEDEYHSRDGEIDRFGREAGSAGVVSHGPPLPSRCIFQVDFQVVFKVVFEAQFRWPDRRRNPSSKLAKGPALGRA